MKRAAVSQRVDIFHDRNEARDALDQRLCVWLWQAGCLPMPIPNRLGSLEDESVDEQQHWQELDRWLAAVLPEVIILSGGNDIGQCMARDQTERRLLSYAKAESLPVLGICRGMQMMGVWAGADLIPVANHVRSNHSLTGEVAGQVNSFHNYALSKCPDEFHTIATAPDGNIEAIRHNSLPWEGWMWHPERDAEFSSRDLQRFRLLINLQTEQ